MTINELHILDKGKHGISAYQGFYFQQLNTLKKWLDNYIYNRDNKIYCETNKDITEIINGNLKNIRFEEIKFYALEKTFTLNTLILKETIFDFFILFLKTKNINTKFIFHTNSKIGKTGKLLHKWAGNKELTKKTKNELIKKLYTIISKIKVQKTLHVYFDDKELTKENISNFIERVKWNFENKEKKASINQLISEIENQINKIKYQEINTNLYIGRLHWEVSKKSQNKKIENRLLDNNLLKNILNEEYNTKFEEKIDITFLNEINKNIEDIKQTQEEGIKENEIFHQKTHELLNETNNKIESLEDTASEIQYNDYIKYGKDLIKEKKFNKAIKIFENVLSSENLSKSAGRKAKSGIKKAKKEKNKNLKKIRINTILILFFLTILFFGILSFINYKNSIKIADNSMQAIDNLILNGTNFYDSKIIHLADTSIYYYLKADETLCGLLINEFNYLIEDNYITELEKAINFKEDECKKLIQSMINRQEEKNEIYQYLTGNFNEGLRLFKFIPNGKFGYLDKNNKVAILPKFDYIPTTDKEIHFTNGKAKVCIEKDTFYININGNRIN